VTAPLTDKPAPSADPCGDDCTTDLVGVGAHGPAVRKVLWLSVLSLVWMTAEGGLGLYAGLTANSVSLVGWALGSVIEGLASVIVIWRFTGSRRLSGTSERRAQKAVAVSFWLLAPYIAVEAVRDLLGGSEVQTTLLGVAVTASSLIVMPALGIAKTRLARHLGSDATAGEGTQNLLCAAQALAVLIGLGVHALIGIGWIDPAIALLLAAWAVREGLEAWRGQGCC
jgi:divalent metal cation (Fe/Co/Zn/Cd) transporter